MVPGPESARSAHMGATRFEDSTSASTKNTTGVDVYLDALKTILIFCGAGLLTSAVAMIFGLDLGPGLF